MKDQMHTAEREEKVDQTGHMERNEKKYFQQKSPDLQTLEV